MKAALRGGDAFQKALAKATEEAKTQGKPLLETHAVRRFTSAQGRVAYLLDVTLQTGEGRNECGAEDLRVELVGIAEAAPGAGGGAKLEARAPLRERTARVDGLVLLPGEEALRLVDDNGFGARNVTDGSGASLCESVITYCDCAC